MSTSTKIIFSTLIAIFAISLGIFSAFAQNPFLSVAGPICWGYIGGMCIYWLWT